MIISSSNNNEDLDSSFKAIDLQNCILKASINIEGRFTKHQIKRILKYKCNLKFYDDQIEELMDNIFLDTNTKLPNLESESTIDRKYMFVNDNKLYSVSPRSFFIRAIDFFLC